MQVIYPARLNGCEVPVIASLPKLLARGTNVLGGEPVYQKVDIPQLSTEEPELKVLPLGGHPSSTLMPSPIRAPLPRRGQHDYGSEGAPIPGDIRYFWTYIKEPYPKETKSHGHTHTPTPQTGSFPRLVDMSSQVSVPDDAEMGDASLEEIPSAISPTAKTLGPSSGIPPADAGHL